MAVFFANSVVLPASCLESDFLMFGFWERLFVQVSGLSGTVVRATVLAPSFQHLEGQKHISATKMDVLAILEVDVYNTISENMLPTPAKSVTE